MSPRSCRTLVDGAEIHRGYRAFFNYFDSFGVLWGPAPYMSKLASATFKSVRWEVLA